jgi:plasmid stability protein
MGQVLVRNIDDEVIASLKLRAELRGKSLEQELRDILSAAAPLTADEKVTVSKRLRAQFAKEDFDAKAAIRWGRDDEVFQLEEKFDSP